MPCRPSSAHRDQADRFFFSSTSSNSASTTFSSGLAPGAAGPAPGPAPGPAAARLRRGARRLLGRLRLVHRLADLHRGLAQPLGGLLQRRRIVALHGRPGRGQRRLGLALLLRADLVAELLQVLARPDGSSRRRGCAVRPSRAAACRSRRWPPPPSPCAGCRLPTARRYAWMRICCSLPVALSRACTETMPLASMSNVTSICGMPRGAGGMPIRSNWPSNLLSAAISRSPW